MRSGCGGRSWVGGGSGGLAKGPSAHESARTDEKTIRGAITTGTVPQSHARARWTPGGAFVRKANGRDDVDVMPCRWPSQPSPPDHLRGAISREPFERAARKSAGRAKEMESVLPREEKQATVTESGRRNSQESNEARPVVESETKRSEAKEAEPSIAPKSRHSSGRSGEGRNRRPGTDLLLSSQRSCRVLRSAVLPRIDWRNPSICGWVASWTRVRSADRSDIAVTQGREGRVRTKHAVVRTPRARSRRRRSR